MTEYATGNPIGSVDVKDLYDNSQNLDHFANDRSTMTWADRLGVSRLTYWGMEQTFYTVLNNNQFEYPPLIYTDGTPLSVARPTQVIQRGSQLYRVRLPATFPVNLTGTWATDAPLLSAMSDDTLRTQLAAVTGSQLVGYRARTVYARLSDTISVEDQAGVNGNGTSDDLGPVNAAIAASPDRMPIELKRRYRVSARPTNASGKPFKGPGQLLLDQDGQQYMINSYTHDLGYSWGREHLDKVFQRLEVGAGQIRMQLYGDSTVAGHNGESAQFYAEALIGKCFAQNGIADVIINNYGVSGTSWTDLNAIPNIDATASNLTDLLCIKYFINDFPKDPAVIFPIVDAKIAAIRAATNGDVHKLAIIIMAASTTYDLPNGRDARWYEQLRAGIIQICQKYSCAFFDSYALMQDSSKGAGWFMDQPWPGQPWAVHMLNRGQNIIWNGLIKEFFPQEYLREWATNGFTVYPSTAGIPPEGTTLPSYAKGLTSYRATWASKNGASFTFRHPDGIGFQDVIPYEGNNPVPAKRFWIPGNNAWSVWSGVTVALTSYLASGMSAVAGRRALGFHRDEDGRLWLEGSVTVTSAKAIGDVFANALPAGYRVVGGDQVGFANGSGGGVRLLFVTDGRILFQSAVSAGTEVSLDSVSAYLG